MPVSTLPRNVLGWRTRPLPGVDVVYLESEHYDAQGTAL